MEQRAGEDFPSSGAIRSRGDGFSTFQAEALTTTNITFDNQGGSFVGPFAP